jgi:hypothetical protein
MCLPACLPAYAVAPVPSIDGSVVCSHCTTDLQGHWWGAVINSDDPLAKEYTS